MTTQSDIKKLASSMNSFDDIKDFQERLMQSFTDTALEAETEYYLVYPKFKKMDNPNDRVYSDIGDLKVSIQRDHASSSESILMRKHQIHISALMTKLSPITEIAFQSPRHLLILAHIPKVKRLLRSLIPSKSLA